MKKYVEGYKWHVARAKRQGFKPMSWPQYVKAAVGIEINIELGCN